MEATELEPLKRLSRDAVKAATQLGIGEIRYLVDGYYSLQEYRKATANQERALGEGGEPHEVITWLRTQSEGLEGQIKRVLDRWTDSHKVSAWAKSITGIGPVIAAGLAAHIDIEKAPTAGHIMSFAGLNPTQVWSKGERRPWNASLKTLCWKIGESFVKVSGLESDIYGKQYLLRKAQEQANNAEHKFADQAQAKLGKFKIGKDTKARGAYEAGLLPDGHIHARAKRWAVKLFLSHYHQVAYTIHYQRPPARPWVIEFGGHAHMIEPPNWPIK